MNKTLFFIVFVSFSFICWGQDLSIVDHKYYSLCYSEEHEQAAWVSYNLTINEVYGDITRTNNFREDPYIREGSATLDDYRGSGFDRGHLAPAADMAFSTIAMSESFYLSNMSPQAPSFNRGIWKKLESYVRKLAFTYGSNFIFSFLYSVDYCERVTGIDFFSYLDDDIEELIESNLNHNFFGSDL